MKEAVEKLLTEQLQTWEMAKVNYKALTEVRVKELNVNGWLYKVQFNPARILSSAAKVDSKSIQARKCFLCAKNLPAAQKKVLFNEHYSILVNPFPIFPKHLTIPETEHVDQLIKERFSDMLELAKELKEYNIFYNGPKCGASAPDHAHFQAGNKGFLPIEKEWIYKKADKIVSYKEASLWYLDDPVRATLVIESNEEEAAIFLFNTIYNALETKPGEMEPMMNILAWYEKNKWIICIFPREKHRPSCYFAEGDKNLLLSPASVDMGGVFITPQEKDFEKITATDIENILREICINNSKFLQLRQLIKEQL